jgi:hypothetical protein
MITLQLKRTIKNLSDNKIKNLILENGEPLLVESSTNTSIEFNTECSTVGDQQKKNVYLNYEKSDLLIIKDGNLLVGTTLIVKFDEENSYSGMPIKLSLVAAGSSSIYTYNVAYLDNNEYNYNIYGSTKYNWSANDTRVFIYDGVNWIIKLLSDYIDSSLLFIGNGKDTVNSLYESGTYIAVSKYVSVDMIKNGSITIKKLDPNIDLASKEALQQISNALDSLSDNTETNFNNVNDKINLNKIYYVTCDTVATSTTKIVNVANLSTQGNIDNYDGLTLVIKFTYGVSIEDYEYLTLRVMDSTGTTQLIPEKPFYVGNNRLSKAFYWEENDTLIFVYNANYLGSIEPSKGVWSMAGTSASSVISNWCYNNSTTAINGAAIYSGTISGEKIMANSITADQIAVGSLPPEVFTQGVQSVIGNLNQFKQQCASAGAIIARCSSDSGDQCKSAYVTEEVLSSISTKLGLNNALIPLTGTSIVVNFLNEDTFFSENGNLNGINFALTTGSDDSRFFEAPLGFIFNGDFVNVGRPLADVQVNSSLYEIINYYKWPANSYRTLMFDGLHWILSITTSYLSKLAEYCLNNNQTWIGGGTVITGTIVADQIQSGSIDTSKVSLVCYGTDDSNDVMNYGGFGAYKGSTGSSRTTGVWMYGATDWGDTDGVPDYHVVITNAGLLINIKNGRISGYGNKWKIDASSGVEIGLNYGNISIGRDSNAENGISTLKIRGKIDVPTSNSGLPTGSIYVDNGILKVVT